MYNSEEMSLFSARAQKGLCSHAYIVDGVNGIGKLDFALYCAQTILCTEHNRPCGYCNQCRKVINGDHPDVFIIGKDKNPLIDDVREIIRRSNLKPNDGEKQVFIICNGNKLNSVSQNALLKIIEEPPQSVVIFLLTESRSSLLPTVLSRGQRVHLDGMRESEIEPLLRKKYPAAEELDIKRALVAGAGNFGKASKYLSKESVSLREKVEKLILCAISGDNFGVSSLIIVPNHTRDGLRNFLQAFTDYVTELQKQKYGVKDAYITANGRLLAINKRALAYMSEVAFNGVMALENSANVNAVKSKFTLDLLRAAKK